MTTSTQVRLARRPEGEPGDDTFSFEEHELPELDDGQVLLRVVYLSLDPYMRGRMSDAPSYADPVEVGDVLVGGTVCVVEESRNPSLEAGDLVLSYSGWQTHAITDGQARAQARPVRRARLHRARRARDAGLHGVRRAARDRPAASPARPSSSQPPPDRSARRSARSRRSRAPVPSASPAARRSRSC